MATNLPQESHYRQVVGLGDSLIGSEVTVSGYAETVRGRGAICFLMLRDGTGHIQAFLKRDNMDQSFFDSIQSVSRESTVQLTGLLPKRGLLKLRRRVSPPPEYEINVTSGLT